jgi:transcriptional regulator of acetoin/glycerol metabolism
VIPLSTSPYFRQTAIRKRCDALPRIFMADDEWRSMNEADLERLPVRVGMTLRAAERVLIAATLEHTGWQVKTAAAILGIDRSTLYDKIRRYGIARGKD